MIAKIYLPAMTFNSTNMLATHIQNPRPYHRLDYVLSPCFNRHFAINVSKMVNSVVPILILKVAARIFP